MLIDVHSSSEAQQDSALQEICRELGAVRRLLLNLLKDHYNLLYLFQHQRRAEASLHYTQSAFLQVKRKAINILVELFPHAQDLQEQIINTAYDLAEDQQFEVNLPNMPKPCFNRPQWSLSLFYILFVACSPLLDSTIGIQQCYRAQPVSTHPMDSTEC